MIDPRHDANDPIVGGVRDALGRRAARPDVDAILARIGGRTPAEVADAARSRALRGASLAAAVVLSVLVFAVLPEPAVTPAPTVAGAERSAVGPLGRLAAPALVTEDADALTSEVALLSDVVFGGLR